MSQLSMHLEAYNESFEQINAKSDHLSPIFESYQTPKYGNLSANLFQIGVIGTNPESDTTQQRKRVKSHDEDPG
jgi:hypothetical protein